MQQSEATADGILIVEDDPAVRRYLGDAFVRAGWTTWLTGDGLEALALFERHRVQISIVLVDVGMPGLDGVEVVRLLHELDPLVRCVFMTGAAVQHPLEYLEQLTGHPVILKPFYPKAIVADMSALLAGRRLA